METRKYIFHKDCLPTYDEFYNEFIKSQEFTYSPIDGELMDIYWKRPRKKMLLAWGCNQLNSMILSNKLSNNFIQFCLCDKLNDTPPSLLLDFATNYSKTYECKIPSTDKYSIFLSNHTYIDIDTLTSDISLSVIKIKNSLSVDEEFIHITDMDEVTSIINSIINLNNN